MPLDLSFLLCPDGRMVIGSDPRAVAAKTKNEPALLIELDADGSASCGGERAFPAGPHDACTLLVGDDRDRCSWVRRPRTHDRLMRGSKGRLAEDCQYQHPLHVTAAVSALELRPRWYVSSGICRMAKSPHVRVRLFAGAGKADRGGHQGSGRCGYSTSMIAVSPTAPFSSRPGPGDAQAGQGRRQGEVRCRSHQRLDHRNQNREGPSKQAESQVSRRNIVDFSGERSPPAAPLPRLACPRMVVSPQALPKGPRKPSRFKSTAMARSDLPAANSRKMRRAI